MLGLSKVRISLHPEVSMMVFPVPVFGLKLLFGEMSGILLARQRVLPAAAEAAGFKFRFPELGGALGDLLVSS